MTAICRHTVLPFSLNGVPASVQPRCLALPMAEVMAEHLIQTVIQLSRYTMEQNYHLTSSYRHKLDKTIALQYHECNVYNLIIKLP